MCERVVRNESVWGESLLTKGSRIKEPVEFEKDLPKEGNEIGDIRVVRNKPEGVEHCSTTCVWDGERWYHNNEPYILPDGRPNKWTMKHLDDLRPNNETQGRPTSFLIKLINNFKRKHGIGDNSHTDLAPGEK